MPRYHGELKGITLLSDIAHYEKSLILYVRCYYHVNMLRKMTERKQEKSDKRKPCRFLNLPNSHDASSSCLSTDASTFFHLCNIWYCRIKI